MFNYSKIEFFLENELCVICCLKLNEVRTGGPPAALSPNPLFSLISDILDEIREMTSEWKDVNPSWVTLFWVNRPFHKTNNISKNFFKPIVMSQQNRAEFKSILHQTSVSACKIGIKQL